MKSRFIVSLLSVFISFSLQTYPIESSRTSAESALNSPLLFAGAYGAMSGLLCRIFEWTVLADVLPLRLCNIFLWGMIERAIINDYKTDLEKQGIIHSPTAVVNLARVVSWLAYFSYSLA